MAELATQLTSNHNRSFQRILTDYEISITRVILFCVSELPFPMGARKISYILKGSKSTFNIEYELYELETFSVLSPYSAKQLTEMIDILVSTELLKTESAVDYTDMPVISLTNKGRAYLSGKVESPVVILDSIIDTEVIKLDEEEKALFEDLQELRRKLAEKKEVPPYVICGDYVLRLICRKRPGTAEELLEINGVGEHFIMNYANLFLEVIKGQS